MGNHYRSTNNSFFKSSQFSINMNQVQESKNRVKEQNDGWFSAHEILQMAKDKVTLEQVIGLLNKASEIGARGVQFTLIGLKDMTLSKAKELRALLDNNWKKLLFAMIGGAVLIATFESSCRVVKASEDESTNVYHGDESLEMYERRRRTMAASNNDCKTQKVADIDMQWQGCHFDDVRIGITEVQGKTLTVTPVQENLVYAQLSDGKDAYSLTSGNRPVESSKVKSSQVKIKCPKQITFKFGNVDEARQFAAIIEKLWQQRGTGSTGRRMAEHEDSSLGQYQSDSSGLKSVCVLLFFVLMFAVSVLILFRG